VPLVERSEHARSLIENKVSGRRWLRPDSEAAEASGMLSASHLLLAELRTPEEGGHYQLSVRLVDVYLGTILWEDQCDRLLLPQGSGSDATLTTLRARTREQEEVRKKEEEARKKAERTPPALIGTWEHRVRGTVGRQRVNQVLTVHQLPDGWINVRGGKDTWFVEGETLVLRTFDAGGNLLEYRGVLAPDRRGYSGKLGGLTFTGQKRSDG
jgi:hypothetical protein